LGYKLLFVDNEVAIGEKKNHHKILPKSQVRKQTPKTISQHKNFKTSKWK